jgi:cytochrome c-type biogenesis protein
VSFADVAAGGPLVLAVGVSAAAGLVSFLSPCVLPLVPGYLSYMTGLAGADLDAASVPPDEAAATVRVRGRIVAGSLLFIAGFTAVFTILSVIAGGIGHAIDDHMRLLEIVIGALIIVLGAGFLGLIPAMQREFRIQKLPAAGLIGAPVLGAVFALSWVPCTGPTLGAVIGLSMVSGEMARSVMLAVAYCLGLGLPFLIFGLGYRRLLGVFRVIRRNSRWVTRAGGVLLVLIGVALITGGWAEFIVWLRATLGTGGVSI